MFIEDFVDLFDNLFDLKLRFYNKDTGITYKYESENNYKLYPEQIADIRFDSVSTPFGGHLTLNIPFDDYKMDPSKIPGMVAIN